MAMRRTIGNVSCQRVGSLRPCYGLERLSKLVKETGSSSYKPQARRGYIVASLEIGRVGGDEPIFRREFELLDVRASIVDIVVVRYVLMGVKITP